MCQQSGPYNACCFADEKSGDDESTLHFHRRPGEGGPDRAGNASTVILLSWADGVVPDGDSKELLSSSGLPASAVIEVSRDHWLAALSGWKRRSGCAGMR